MAEKPNPLPASPSSREQLRAIPEMEVADFQKLMRTHFGVLSEPTDREYLIKFAGPPYKEEVESCRSLGIMAHGRGTKFSPHNIKQVLAKFGISEAQFLEAYDLAMNRVSPIRPNSPAA